MHSMKNFRAMVDRVAPGTAAKDTAADSAAAPAAARPTKKADSGKKKSKS
jgi:hypothetical protein